MRLPLIGSVCITLLFTILSSCSTFKPPSVLPQQISWQTREAVLAKINQWHLNGKLAVHTPRDSGSATIDWTQHQDHYQISLYGPLGSGGMTLSGHEGHIVLKTNDGKRYTANSPENLLAEHWGFKLPVSNLRYWVRGMPVPGLMAQSHQDRFGRLNAFYQAGWDIRYDDYQTVQGVDLPRKITITDGHLTMKLVIYTWDLQGKA